jgi:hypothetical protein
MKKFKLSNNLLKELFKFDTLSNNLKLMLINKQLLKVIKDYYTINQNSWKLYKILLNSHPKYKDKLSDNHLINLKEKDFISNIPQAYSLYFIIILNIETQLNLQFNMNNKI